MSVRGIAAAFGAFLLAALPSGGGNGSRLELKYVAIVARHGVRSPTWENSRLNAYSAEPWPAWDVPPGNLTPHGRKLIELLGSYYRDWLAGERLLHLAGCRDAGRIYIRADKDQRTLETGRAFSESLLSGCPIEVHAEPEGQPDHLFSGLRSPDPDRALAAVRERLGPDPQELVAKHREALDVLQSIVTVKTGRYDPVAVTGKGKSIELSGPFATGSTFSENLLLEYAEGMQGDSLGWGRLTREKLEKILEVHAVYAELMRRTSYLARARGSNLLSHVLQSLDQAATGKAARGALGRPGDSVLLLAGHDTNLANLSGMLGLSWKLAGYQPDDTPPGGALIFALWRDRGSGSYFLRLRYLAQSLDQMRSASPLSSSTPPESQDLSLPGCPLAACPWETARQVLQRAIDPTFAEND